MKTLLKLLPWICVAVFGAEIVAVMWPKSDGPMHVKEFGRLPVLLNGRYQPFDSVAHNSLLQIRSTADVPLELYPSWQFWRHAPKLRSTEWLLEVLFKPDVADTRPIFLIHHPDLISELKLGDKGMEKSGLRYYTFNELKAALPEIANQGRSAESVADVQRTTYQKQVLKLANALMLYHRLKNSIQPEDTPDFARLVAQYQESMPAGLAAFRAQQAGQAADQDALVRFGALVRLFDEQSNLAYPLVIPSINPEDRNDWQNMGASLFGVIQTGEVHPAVGYFARISGSYVRDDATEFNSAVAGYKNWLNRDYSREVRKGRAEFYFNQIKIFLHGTIIYLAAFLLAGGALLTFGVWTNLSEAFRRSSLYLIVLAFTVHTFGLLFRMLLEGRPPVTNLYSSAIFIGWGACVLGLVLERIYKVAIGCAVSAFAGFITLIIAHNIVLYVSDNKDTMEMLRAVLDTNFWLATHVVVVTLGYASTFVAGLLAIAYIVLGVFTPNLTRALSERASTAVGAAAGLGAMVVTGGVTGIAGGTAIAASATRSAHSGNLGKALAKMVYAIVCFATLFSFTGTVLGGIWADQSWGRFWGWDPKENGALLIVIWNVIILHARWGGLVRERGVVCLAVVGNIVTSFSWFGVNMLGIGLHAYGFMDAAFKWLLLFVVSQLAIIAVGCLPLRRWRSFRDGASTARPAGAAAVG
jgi:cytochrome c-type biogenesis protein CcsB